MYQEILTSRDLLRQRGFRRKLFYFTTPILGKLMGKYGQFVSPRCVFDVLYLEGLLLILKASVCLPLCVEGAVFCIAYADVVFSDGALPFSC